MDQQRHTTPARSRQLIGQVASLTGLSRQTIRRFDAAGLLHPSRTAGGFRLYSGQDVRRLVMVRQMQPLGFTLGERAILVDVVSRLEVADDPELRSALLMRLREAIADAERRREVLRTQTAAVDRFIHEVKAAAGGSPE